MKRVPMITGVLAGLAGFLTVRSTNMTNQANYNSTHAVLHQAQASDHWSEYQADSVKKHMEDTLARTTTDPVLRKQLLDEANDFGNRQPPLKQKAIDQENLRDAELQNSDQKLRVKGFLDYSGMAAQLGIALASVAALTKKKAAYQIGLFAGILAFLITGYALAYPLVLGLLKHS
jgi:hypothetical protein